MMDPNPSELGDRYTVLTIEQALAALLAAWRRFFGAAPPWRCVMVLLAHTAHESGRWHALHHFNVGNIKSSPGDGRCWTYYGSGCSEVIDGKSVAFQGRHEQNRFRAYRDPIDGFQDYLGVLARSYPRALAMAVDGDVQAFCHELANAGAPGHPYRYYTAPESSYTASVALLCREFARSIAEPEGYAAQQGSIDTILLAIDPSLAKP